MVVPTQFDYSKTSKNDKHRRRTYQFIANLVVTIGFGVSSLINGRDETLDFESLRLSGGYWIRDGSLRFCHIAREEETHETPSVRS